MADPSETRTPKGRAPHRRNEVARLAVLRAADDLVAERGYGGVSIEGIASRAGVAKQTIYRWWPSKVDILLDTLAEDTEGDLAVPTTGSAEQRLRRYLRTYARFLAGDPGKVLLALLGEAQHDAAVAALVRERHLAPQRARERTMLEAGAASGELAVDLDPDAVLDALCGPVVYRAMTGAKAPKAFTDRLLDDVLGALRASSPP